MFELVIIFIGSNSTSLTSFLASTTGAAAEVAGAVLQPCSSSVLRIAKNIIFFIKSPLLNSICIKRNQSTITASVTIRLNRPQVSQMICA